MLQPPHVLLVCHSELDLHEANGGEGSASPGCSEFHSVSVVALQVQEQAGQPAAARRSGGSTSRG